MNLKSNDNIFNAYNDKYIYMNVNGTIRQFFVKRAPLDTDFESYTKLDPITDSYNIISESSAQNCND
jgi:hypothetical protein